MVLNFQFLEQLLQRRYMESVPSIVPLLEHEHRSAATKLKETSHELGSLDVPRLKERGRAFREAFIKSLLTLLRGNYCYNIFACGHSLLVSSYIKTKCTLVGCNDQVPARLHPRDLVKHSLTSTSEGESLSLRLLMKMTEPLAHKQAFKQRLKEFQTHT